MPEKNLLQALQIFRQALPAQARVYVGGCSGEPLNVGNAFTKRPVLAAGVTFLGIWIPGVNHTDWGGLHEDTRAESIFIGPVQRPSFESGNTSFLPLSYTQSWTWLQTTPMDGAIIMVSPPDDEGYVSLSVSSDFARAVLDRRDVKCLAILNPHLPNLKKAPRYPVSHFDYSVEDDFPLVQLASKPLPAAFSEIGEHIRRLIRNGDTLQFGLGNVQQAVLKALNDHKDLRLHTGMISDPVIALLESGSIAEHQDAITTGVALGTNSLYDRAAREQRIRFQPVSYTHAIDTLAAIPRFMAINSCIEIDLFGQVNAEFIGPRQISGTGGLVDFMRGASASPGGRAITALTSTARQGTISRIVPRLNPNAVSIARADMDTVVTEHGIAQLKYKTIDQRAEALISIADPAFQSELMTAWATMRRNQ